MCIEFKLFEQKILDENDCIRYCRKEEYNN